MILVMTTTIPRTARGRATRERILQAATSLISERGVAATSLDDVRELAHASKSQLYLYFPDRDALLREVAGSTCDMVIGGQADILAAVDSIEGLERYLDAIVALHVCQDQPGGCPIASLAGQLADHDEQARLILADGLGRWEDGLRSGLETMVAKGELRPDADPRLLATQMLTIIQGGLLLTQVRRDIGQLQTATQTALSLVRAALI
jgi:TetR/AcrR family transcriptional repressor of nem operon